jgi:hypothetical protein
LAPFGDQPLHGLSQLLQASSAELTADEAKRAMSSLERRIRGNKGAISRVCMSTMKEDKFHWLASGLLFCLSAPGQEECNSQTNYAVRAT